MIRTEPRRCEDVDDLMRALIEERARNPLLGSCGLAVDSGTEAGDPFDIDGIRGLTFTSRALATYVQDAEEIRTELAEHHAGCHTVVEMDRERRRTRRSEESLRYQQIRNERLGADFDRVVDELKERDREVARLRDAIEEHREAIGSRDFQRVCNADQALYAAAEEQP